MSWHCPKCKINYGQNFGNGTCPGCNTELKEEDIMANTIKFTGNKDRFAGQKKGILLSADLKIVKEMSDELKSNVGEDCIPRGSSILCVYVGEKGIPFVELRNYGSATLHKLKKSIGQEFEVDMPIPDNQERMPI
jgi:hypothetical protein